MARNFGTRRSFGGRLLLPVLMVLTVLPLVLRVSLPGSCLLHLSSQEVQSDLRRLGGSAKAAWSEMMETQASEDRDLLHAWDERLRVEARSKAAAEQGKAKQEATALHEFQSDLRRLGDSAKAAWREAMETQASEDRALLRAWAERLQVEARSKAAAEQRKAKQEATALLKDAEGKGSQAWQDAVRRAKEFEYKAARKARALLIEAEQKVEALMLDSEM